MKATELRIGNLVYNSYGNVEEVESIRHNGIGETIGKYGEIDCMTEFELLKPIPLTEEWLERFGFAFECRWVNDCRAVKGDFHITMDHDGETVIGYPTSVGMGNQWMFVQDIEYVHQLQNLYFAITGKELELK